MARFGLRYDRLATPIVWGLGLIPPLTYVDVSDGRIQVRLGPWFVLEAPLDQVAWADVARGDLPATPVEHRQTPAHSSIQVTTSRGPVVRIRFRETQRARLLFGPPRLRPEVVLVNIGPSVEVDQLALSVRDPDGLAAALTA